MNDLLPLPTAAAPTAGERLRLALRRARGGRLGDRLPTMTADEADAALSDAARLRLDPGEVCTLARLRAGLTQAQVAADLGVAKMTVSLWERRACPGRDYLIEYWRARGYAALLPAARPHAGSAQLRGAYERGRVAGLAGEPSSSCPYAITPGRGGFRRVWRFNWLAGWRAGEAERRKSLG